MGTNVYQYNVNSKKREVHIEQQLVESIEVSPEPRIKVNSEQTIDVDKSQENIKKIKDIEHKQKVEL